eukprot:Seg3771.2 transcript_id=Seg3771.2/GoldUCD/mRNA.D3Y31 product="hypothetical protein" protein_id=Seg3771.2/GoldUCD/D3Y31
MKVDRQSEQRQLLNERRAVSIIYMMMYGQSQQANWLQVATAHAFKGLGVSSRDIKTLRNMGLATHPLTVSKACNKILTFNKCHAIGNSRLTFQVACMGELAKDSSGPSKMN